MTKQTILASIMRFVNAERANLADHLWLPKLAAAIERDIAPPTEASELLPCPFCGETKRLSYDDNDAIWCDSCQASGPTAKQHKVSVERWNRRAQWAGPLKPPEE